MVLIKYDRYGEVYDIKRGDYTQLLSHLEYLTEELESKGIMLINTEVNHNLTRLDEFASTENGWECALIITNGRIDSIK